MSWEMQAKAIASVTAAIENQTAAVTKNMQAIALAAQFADDSRARLTATVNEIIKGNASMQDFAKTGMGGYLESLEEVFERLRTAKISVQERVMTEQSLGLMRRILAEFGLSVDQLRAKSDQFYRDQQNPNRRPAAASPAGGSSDTGFSFAKALSTGQLK